MAYGIKYRFRFNSANGVEHTVNLLQDGYSGSVINRALGRAPVIKMQDSGLFRGTSCDLVLECQTDGEFALLYTSNPRQYRVDVFRGSTQVWSGFIVTELYAEPDIAPRYDVSVTATDGLGLLKDYDFPARGLQTVGDHLRYLLSQTGLSMVINCVLSMGPTSGSPATLFDGVSINLDYLEGENCYDVLSELLRTLHMTVTQYKGAWLLIRESDLAGCLSGTGLSVYQLPTRTSGSTTTATVSGVKQTLGSAYSGNMWPVGHLTRRAVPAKRSITVEAPWHAHDVDSTAGWLIESRAAWESAYSRYWVGNVLASMAVAGSIINQMTVRRFNKDLRFSLLASVHSAGTMSFVGVTAQLTYGNTTLYWHPDSGWTSTSPATYDRVTVSESNISALPENASKIDVNIPAPGITQECTVQLWIYGYNVDIYGVGVSIRLNAGYRDILALSNGARGRADDVTITGGRTTDEELMSTLFLQGVFVWTSDTGTPVYAWADNRYYGRDLLSLVAMDYALSIALPRVELSGRLNVQAGLSLVPMVVDLRGTNYLVKEYTWDFYNDELEIKAVSLPAASLTVESETVQSTGQAEGGSYAPSSSSEGGGGGITTETDPVFSASPAAGITQADIDKWNSSAGGGSTVKVTSHATAAAASLIATIEVDGTAVGIYNDVRWGSYDSTKKTVMVTINGTTRELCVDGYASGGGSSYTLPAATSGALGGVRIGYEQTGKNYPVLLDGNNRAYVNVPWEASSIEGLSRKAPRIQIYRGFNKSEQYAFAPYLLAEHPAIGTVTDAEFVLMMMSPRRARRTGNQLCKARKGWGAALGKTGEGGLTFSSQVTLLALRTYILQNYVSVFGQDTSSMTYATYQSLRLATGFGFPTGTETLYRKKVKRSRVFGIAVRWTNPEFRELASGPLSDHTTEIYENGKYIPRWIYSDVAPIRVSAEVGQLDNIAGATHTGGVIGFQLLP